MIEGTPLVTEANRLQAAVASAFDSQMAMARMRPPDSSHHDPICHQARSPRGDLLEIAHRPEKVPQDAWTWVGPMASVIYFIAP